MKKEIWIFAGLMLIFLLIRLPGLGLPYHQDEMKTAVDLYISGENALSGLHHPPLTQILFRLDGSLFGTDHLRTLPLIFSALTFALLFLIVRSRAGGKAALLSLGLFSICFYSVYASIMLDTDGGVLPFFFLLAVYFYDKWKAEQGRRGGAWLCLLFLALFMGFMVKLSFILVVGAIALDYLWDIRAKLTRKKAMIGLIALAGFLCISALAIIAVHYIYPAFKIDAMISHALSYVRFEDRGYMQSLIQGLKAIFYLSPLLLVPLMYTTKEIFNRTRVFFLYLILGFVFYFVIFDFSEGALDKYLMFTVVPLVAISAVILSQLILIESGKRKDLFLYLTLGALLGALLIAVNFMPHAIVALYPKEEWFSRVIGLKWSMLNPFTGGNGPLGFYISFLFIALSFIVSLAIGIMGFFRQEWRRAAMLMLIVIGLAYNLVFIEELVYGRINGHAPDVLREAISRLESDSRIKTVITYNDSGGYELNKLGKYGGRFYAVPQFEENNRMKFQNHTEDQGGHFLLIDIPHINETGFYGRFFAGCESVFETRSQRIVGRILDCSKSAIESANMIE